MKHIYTLIALVFTSIGFAQNYEFALVQNSDYNFSVVAIPDFDSSGNTDISDIGFALMLPAGNADVVNLAQFNGRELSSTQVDAATLTANGLGDGTRDGFLINLPPGQTLLAHTSGEQIVIVSFDVTNMPTSGQLEILTNSDPIAQGLGGAFDSFYNANIDNTTTQDYFVGIATGQGSIMFSTLGINTVVKDEFLIHIYPNPASEYIHIKSDTQIIEIELFENSGKQILKTKTTNPINVMHLSNGVYFLKIGFINGSLVKKIVIN